MRYPHGSAALGWIVVQLYSVGELAHGADDAGDDVPRTGVYALPRYRREFDWRKAARTDDDDTAALTPTPPKSSA